MSLERTKCLIQGSACDARDASSTGQWAWAGSISFIQSRSHKRTKAQGRSGISFHSLTKLDKPDRRREGSVFDTSERWWAWLGWWFGPTWGSTSGGDRRWRRWVVSWIFELLLKWHVTSKEHFLRRCQGIFLVDFRHYFAYLYQKSSTQGLEKYLLIC